MSNLYPLSDKETLKKLYVGKSIRDVPTPAAILDVAVAKNNCDKMLEACDVLDLQWRAHVKTHKTLELTKLQVGPATSPRPINLIYSTFSEANLLLLWLQQQQQSTSLSDRKCNILYGLPISPGSVEPLTALSLALPQGSVSILLDHPSQLPSAALLSKNSNKPPCIFIKIDMGGHRAGVPPNTPEFTTLVTQTLALHAQGTVKLAGLYSHAGHSYAGDSEGDAMLMLGAEIEALVKGAEGIWSAAAGKREGLELTLSVGASPTALAVRNLLRDKDSNEGGDGDRHNKAAAAKDLHSLITSIKATPGLNLEIHAGVYPTLDLQQLAAHSLSLSTQSWADIAFTLLAEVISIYPGRGFKQSSSDGITKASTADDEALIGAGGLALGREFCKAYPGMAMLTPWNRKEENEIEKSLVGKRVDEFQGWIVGRFAQEHGIVTWMRGDGKEGEKMLEVDPLQVGQKVRLWPNHACITGSHFGWYFVVDSSREGKEEEIVDIWVRCRGW